jgi:hypothetical protein
MAVDRVLAALAEAPHQQIGEAGRDGQQLLATGAAGDGDSGLDEVARAVHLVPPVELREPALGVDP